ncbi:hypothetical protein SD81_030770 [Tolypothrix campylonemoides VB511288]|nr:hypothetical protein SD81_030770 [Tolypothrix campylonemoides VB511288]
MSGRYFETTEAEQKIMQLKNALKSLSEARRTERATAEAKIADLKVELSVLQKVEVVQDK